MVYLTYKLKKKRIPHISVINKEDMDIWRKTMFYSLNLQGKESVIIITLVIIVLTGYRGIVMSSFVFPFITFSKGIMTARQLHLEFMGII